MLNPITQSRDALRYVAYKTMSGEAAPKVAEFLLKSPKMQEMAVKDPRAFKDLVIDISRRSSTVRSIPKAAENRPSTPNELDTDSSTPANEKVEPKPTPTTKPRGREKWASDGYEKVASMDSSLDKASLMKDPRKRELLIAASDLRPGSKAMDRILEKLRKGN
jgi:hypothetical protein